SSLAISICVAFSSIGTVVRVSIVSACRSRPHSRVEQLSEEVDADVLLRHRIRVDLQRLENGDSLLVPSLGPVVTVEGMVRRPALYEVRGEKTLEDALDLAGGILPAAALRHIEVQRLEIGRAHV